MGEVVLPLEYLSKQADDLLIVSPQSGMIIDHNELAKGDFPSNSVTFRFLTNYLERPEAVKRHGLFNLKQSRTFANFNEGLQSFVKNPAGELKAWKKTLFDFFDSLKALFPAGNTTFNLAHDFFVKESENFINGNNHGEIFENNSLEKKEDKFVSAIYAKGSYALARAGDVSGALHGMSFASLTDLNDNNHQSVLGEYLDDLKQQYFSHESDSKIQNLYEIHLSHNFSKKLLANPYYKPLGESFIKTTRLNLRLPQSDEPKKIKNTGFGYGAYGKF